MDAGIVDFHVHLQPSAAEGIAFQRQFGFEHPKRTGTVAEALGVMDEAGVAQALMVPWMPAQQLVERRLVERACEDAPALSWAERREAVRHEVVEEWLALNQWAVEMVARHPSRLHCLVGLDPVLMREEELRREVADKLGKGACGLKIAPLFVRAPADDPRLAIVFELAAQHGVFVLSQAGANGYGGEPAWGHPRHFEAVLAAWPSVDVQLAHLGLGAEAEVARLAARYPNLYADTSARLHEIGRPGGWSPAEAAEWLRRIGIDRVVFGTNYPMHEPAEFAHVIRELPLREEEREKVLHANAEGILARAAARRAARGGGGAAAGRG
jgi:hypothetical protein